MKKYYIPTSSLNFNNILSTESVSPKAFYECRGFGYDRWTSIPENSCEFAVTLYDYPGSFVRSQSDLEDHPLLIEYATDEDFPKVGDGVYACRHTLYFNPTTTLFIFFAEQDKKVALSLTESSLETKLVSVYRWRMVVDSFERRYAPIGIRGFDEIEYSEVEKDRQINRMKGLLYGYYVGASIAAAPEQVKKLGIYLKIHNVFAAVASSVEREPTEAQCTQLKSAFNELNRFNPLYNDLLEFEGEDVRVERLIAILKKHGKDILPNDTDGLVASLKGGPAVECYGMRWIEDQIRQTQMSMAGQRVYLSPNKEEILVIDGKLAKICNEFIADELMQNLFVSWANEVLVKPEFNGKVSSCKSALADALTFKAKELLGSEWVDGNPVRCYLNALRRHVIGKNEFSEEWHDNLLSAVAAILSKGDDWEGLLRFMQAKGLADCRLAFAIYGELNGFANLTRDFTDVVLCRQNKERRAVYQEFHGQLLDQRIDWSILEKPHDVMQKVPHEVAHCTEDLRTRVLGFFDGPSFECKLTRAVKKDMRSQLLWIFEETSNNPKPDDFIKSLAKRKGWGERTKAWKLMQKEFAPNFQNAVNFKSRQKKKGCVDGVESEAFPTKAPPRQLELLKLPAEDSPAEVCLAPVSVYDEKLLVHDQELRLAIEEKFADLGPDRVRQLVWSVSEFCKKYAPGGWYWKNPNKYQQENPDLIDHLLRCLISDKTTDLNFRWQGEEAKRFQSFLEARYRCSRKVHDAKK